MGRNEKFAPVTKIILKWVAKSPQPPCLIGRASIQRSAILQALARWTVFVGVNYSDIHLHCSGNLTMGGLRQN